MTRKLKTSAEKAYDEARAQAWKAYKETIERR